MNSNHCLFLNIEDKMFWNYYIQLQFAETGIALVWDLHCCPTVPKSGVWNVFLCRRCFNSKTWTILGLPADDCLVKKRYVCKYCHTHILPFGFKGVWVKWCGSDYLETLFSLGWSQTSDDPVSHLPEYCDDRSLSRWPGYHVLYFYDS